MSNKIKTKYLKLFFCLFFLILLIAPIFSIYAAGLVPCGNKDEPACTLNDLLYTLIPNVLGFVWYSLVPALAVIWFAFAGYKMITSNGDPGKYKEGKDMIIYGAVGIVIVFSAYVLVTTFLDLIGVADWVKTFLNDTTPTP